jgi:hypothetical protein
MTCGLGLPECGILILLKNKRWGKIRTFDFNLESERASNGHFVVIKSGHDEWFALERQTVLGQTQ